MCKVCLVFFLQQTSRTLICLLISAAPYLQGVGYMLDPLPDSTFEDLCSSQNQTRDLSLVRHQTVEPGLFQTFIFMCKSVICVGNVRLNRSKLQITDGKTFYLKKKG